MPKKKFTKVKNFPPKVDKFPPLQKSQQQDGKNTKDCVGGLGRFRAKGY